MAPTKSNLLKRVQQIALFLVIASSACASKAVTITPTNKVRFYMNVGVVEIELYGTQSPLNVANFLSYVDNGTYDNSFIHRTRSEDASQPLGYDLFAQGGSFKYPTNQYIDSNPIPAGPTVKNEFNAANGLSNIAYTLSAARGSDPDSASTGWFINQTNNAAAFDPGPYTVLGKVTRGTSIIDQIPFLPNSNGLQGGIFETTPFYNGDLVTILKAIRIPIVEGDYNFSGSVTAADYTLWRNNFGSTTNLALDGNGNGIVDASDYVLYRKKFGQSSGSGSGSLADFNVPEPTSSFLILTAGLLLGCLRRRRLGAFPSMPSC